MSLRVVVSHQAEEQIDAALSWIAENSGDLAARWYEQLMAVLAGLGQHPQKYAIAAEEELQYHEVREMLFGRRKNVYRVLYRVESDTVRILAIIHGRRKPIDPSDLPI